MSEKFTVEIISPEKSILNTEANEVILPSYEGEMGILRDHIPLITFLRPGLIKVKNENEKNFFIEEGTVEFSNKTDSMFLYKLILGFFKIEAQQN